MSPLVTALLALAIVGILAIIVAGPIRAVREDRGYALEERGWLAAGGLPSKVEREYRHARLILTDGIRLRELGYELAERRTVRGAWGRLQAITWRAVRAPAHSEEAPAATRITGMDGSGTEDGADARAHP
jgi:hypothetical protein